MVFLDRLPTPGNQAPKFQAKIAVPFDIVAITANPLNPRFSPLSSCSGLRFFGPHLFIPRYVCVSGLRNLAVFILEGEGEGLFSNDQLSPTLSLSEEGYVLKAVWLPHSQVHLAIVSENFVKIFDLSADVMSPKYYYSLENDPTTVITDACFSSAPKERSQLVEEYLKTLFVFVATSTGQVLVQSLDIGEGLGAVPLLSHLAGTRDEVFEPHPIVSLALIPAHNALFYSFSNGTHTFSFRPSHFSHPLSLYS